MDRPKRGDASHRRYLGIGRLCRPRRDDAGNGRIVEISFFRKDLVLFYSRLSTVEIPTGEEETSDGGD